MHPCPRGEETGMSVLLKRAAKSSWVIHGGHRACSYCGSGHPEDFFKAIEEGKKVTPTDKNYKVYTEGYVKYYFQHFTGENKKKLIDLLNAKKVAFDYPGHFYVLPYFIGRP